MVLDLLCMIIRYFNLMLCFNLGNIIRINMESSVKDHRSIRIMWETVLVLIAFLI